jgi:hypothetical protein
MSLRRYITGRFSQTGTPGSGFGRARALHARFAGMSLRRYITGRFSQTGR